MNLSDEISLLQLGVVLVKIVFNLNCFIFIHISNQKLLARFQNFNFLALILDISFWHAYVLSFNSFYFLNFFGGYQDQAYEPQLICGLTLRIRKLPWKKNGRNPNNNKINWIVFFDVFSGDSVTMAQQLFSKYKPQINYHYFSSIYRTSQRLRRVQASEDKIDWISRKYLGQSQDFSERVIY